MVVRLARVRTETLKKKKHIRMGPGGVKKGEKDERQKHQEQNDDRQ